MRLKSKTTEKKVKALTQPDIRFMAFVDHGANQTPFAVVKRAFPETGDKTMGIRRKETAAKGAADQKNVAVRKVAFDGATFADEAAVTKWLDEYGWEGYVVAKTDGGFEAAAEGAKDEDFSDLRTVKAADGVTAHVGKRVESEDEGDDEGEEEVAAKGDETPAETVEAAKPVKDDAPADVAKGDDVEWPAEADALVETIKACGVEVPELSTKGMYTVNQVGSVLSQMKYLHNYAEEYGLDDSDTKALKVAAKQLSTILTKAMAKTVGEFEDAFKAAKPEGETTTKTDEQPAVQTPASTEDKGADLAAFAEIVNQAIAKAVDPLNKRLDEVAANVDNATKAANEAKEISAKTAKTTEETLSRSPVKKGSAEPIVTDTAKKTEVKTPEQTAKAEAFRKRLGL